MVVVTRTSQYKQKMKALILTIHMRKFYSSRKNLNVTSFRLLQMPNSISEHSRNFDI